MTISSRTPEGDPHRCAICGELAITETSQPLGDSVCPRCGALLVWFRDSLGSQKLDFDTLLTRELGLDSLDMVELAMELQEDAPLLSVAVGK